MAMNTRQHYGPYCCCSRPSTIEQRRAAKKEKDLLRTSSRAPLDDNSIDPTEVELERTKGSFDTMDKKTFDSDSPKVNTIDPMRQSGISKDPFSQ